MRCWRRLPTQKVSDGQLTGSGRVDVTWSGGDSYRISARGHALLTDQPVAEGGHDQAPTPTEVMVGALASCIAFYVGRYLRRHELDPVGFGVRADFGMASDSPARISDVRLVIHVPGGVPDNRRNALLAVASHCTVHNTLRQPPEVTITRSRWTDPTPGPGATAGTHSVGDASESSLIP